jgi:hypothetical protein
MIGLTGTFAVHATTAKEGLAKIDPIRAQASQILAKVIPNEIPMKKLRNDT